LDGNSVGPGVGFLTGVKKNGRGVGGDVGDEVGSPVGVLDGEVVGDEVGNSVGEDVDGSIVGSLVVGSLVNFEDLLLLLVIFDTEDLLLLLVIFDTEVLLLLLLFCLNWRLENLGAVISLLPRTPTLLPTRRSGSSKDPLAIIGVSAISLPVV